MISLASGKTRCKTPAWTMIPIRHWPLCLSPFALHLGARAARLCPSGSWPGGHQRLTASFEPRGAPDGLVRSPLSTSLSSSLEVALHPASSSISS